MNARSCAPINSVYAPFPADFYSSQLLNKGLRGVWFRNRQIKARKLVQKYHDAGIVLDIGCGNCLWKWDNIPTVGVDICEQMLKYNTNRLQHFYPLKGDLRRGLPIKDASVDTVVMTEVLEHFDSYAFLISEINRVLKKGGKAIISVPYSRLPGLWGVVFPLWCFYKWFKYKDIYYRDHCGHVVSFNLRFLKKLLAGFTVMEDLNFGFLTLFLVSRKD